MHKELKLTKIFVEHGRHACWSLVWSNSSGNSSLEAALQNMYPFLDPQIWVQIVILTNHLPNQSAQKHLAAAFCFASVSSWRSLQAVSHTYLWTQWNLTPDRHRAKKRLALLPATKSQTVDLNNKKRMNLAGSHWAHQNERGFLWLHWRVTKSFVSAAYTTCTENLQSAHTEERTPRGIAS